MTALEWMAVGTAVASTLLALIAVLGRRSLREDMYQAPDKTAWGLLSELMRLGVEGHHHRGHDREVRIAGHDHGVRIAGHHRRPEHQADRDGGS